MSHYYGLYSNLAGSPKKQNKINMADRRVLSDYFTHMFKFICVTSQLFIIWSHENFVSS